MTATTFLEYLQKIFYPFLCEQEIQFPVVLFVDGHSSHLSLETAEFCLEKKIVLIALYPNSTHLIQPMDVAVFGPLKKNWRHAVHRWKFENHDSKSLTKEHFAKLLHHVVVEKVKPEYLQSGFRTSGLFPFNPDGINYEKLVGKNTNQDAENEIETETKEIERKKFAVIFEGISEMISAEKKLAFFEFYSFGNTKPWVGAVEDTTAYYIWREAFQRSRKPEIMVMEESEQIEDQNDFLIEETLNDWNLDPGVNYFENIEDYQLEFVDQMCPNEGSSIEDRLIYVLDNTVLVPAPAPSTQNFEPATTSLSETETHSVVAGHRQVSPNESELPVISPNEASSVTTQQTKPDVSMASLYNLSAADATCQVNDVFLKCLQPQPTTTEAEKSEQKFSVPKITGKISLNFSSANESHYISCIDFTSGTSVVSSKWHREYIQKHKEKNELAAERRLQRKNKKLSARISMKNKEVARKSTRRRINKFVFTDTDAGCSDDDDDFELQKKKKKKNVKKPRAPLMPWDTPNLDTSFSSESSCFSPKPKKIRSKLSYTTDEN